MTLESLISSGLELLEQGDYAKAIDEFSEALKLSDSSFKAYLNRSIAYQRIQKLDLALKDVDQAIHIARDLRQSQEYISTSYLRKAIILYLLKNYPESYQNILLAQKYNCSDMTFPSWKSKIEAKLDSIEKSRPAEAAPVSSAVETGSSNEKPLAPQASSTQPSPRIDWYQNSKEVNISIFVKKIDKSLLKVHFGEDSLEASFPLPDSGESYTYKIEKLFGKIDPSKSSFTVFGTKLELTLIKIESAQWSSIESDLQSQSSRTNEELPLTYPSSSKKKIDWSKLEDEDDAKDDQSPDAFFQQLYKNADDDSKKAMMKSFIESGGKSLSTNWDNVENKDFSVDAEP